jgi:NAD(P)-dependent dehydrogenase (short-subunit alcohol dehydrogenase family)
MNRLKDKVVVITGASKGFGAALAREFASAGGKVVASARSLQALEDVVNGIRSAGGEAYAVPADVTREADVLALADKARERYGIIDVWVNNAGVLYRDAIDAFKAGELRASFETNVYGTFYGCKAAAQVMKPQRKGHIINIISTSGMIGRKDESVYCASKWAVRGLHESLKQELNPYDIRLTAVYPGGMKTELFNRYGQQPADFMDPAEVAKLVTSLAATPPELAPTELVVQRQRMIRS